MWDFTDDVFIAKLAVFGHTCEIFCNFAFMLNFTQLFRPWFLRRHLSALHAHEDARHTQCRELARLLRAGISTETGHKWSFAGIRTPEEYSQLVPVRPYNELRADVMRMIAGERDVLWPGITRRFAQSSGTSDGKSKYIPVTDDSLRINHYRGGIDSVAHYLALNPSSRILSGKAFILGGSFANEIASLPSGVKVGDLSAHLIECINPLAERVRIPCRTTALMADWSIKVERLVEESLKADVTNISGVPSWFLTVLRRVIERAGATSIHEVWPHLEVFFHGGISFAPYRDQYAAITDPERMHYLETYNASEGFFAVADTADPGAGMLLMLDAGIFYEFISVGADGQSFPEVRYAWNVECGRTYAMVITAPNGLWRYPTGDTVRVESTHPLRITVAGRTKHYINAFGEELMVSNAERAMTMTCEAIGATVANFTAAPVYTTEHTKGHHQWLIEFDREPADIDRFAALLDENLCRVNSDYQAKRSDNIFLAPLTVTVAPRGLFDKWLASTGKLGGQRKVPRLYPDRSIIEAMLNKI